MKKKSIKPSQKLAFKSISDDQLGRIVGGRGGIVSAIKVELPVINAVKVQLPIFNKLP